MIDLTLELGHAKKILSSRGQPITCSCFSLILYLCSCFWTSESSLLRRLSRPLYLCVPLLLLLNRKVFTSSFFDMCLSLRVGVENVKDIQSKKTQIFTKIECFSKDTLKIVKGQLQCKKRLETSDYQSNAW